MASLGDYNDDGYSDLAIGAAGDGGSGYMRGAVYLLSLTSTGVVRYFLKLSDSEGGIGNNGLFTASLADSDLFGCSLAGLGI